MNRVPKFPISIWGKLQSKKYKRESENRFEFLELSFDWNCLDTPLCGPLSVVIKDFCFPHSILETYVSSETYLQKTTTIEINEIINTKSQNRNQWKNKKKNFHNFCC